MQMTMKKSRQFGEKNRAINADAVNHCSSSSSSSWQLLPYHQSMQQPCERAGMCVHVSTAAHLSPAQAAHLGGLCWVAKHSVPLQLPLGVVCSADHNVDIALEQLLHSKVVGRVVEGELGCACAQRPRRAGVNKPARKHRCTDQLRNPFCFLIPIAPFSVCLSPPAHTLLLQLTSSFPPLNVSIKMNESP